MDNNDSQHLNYRTDLETLERVTMNYRTDVETLE